MKYEPKMYKLANGATVILDPMDAATVYATVAFRTGSQDEKPSEYGLTHFCEHMLCKGTPRFPTPRAIDDYVADNAGFRGASTGPEYMKLYGGILAENATVLLDVFSDQLQNSLFDEDVLERERGVIVDELRRAQDDSNRQYSEFISNKIMGSTMPQYRTLGSVENIMSFTRKQMKLFLARRLSAKNCLICVSGKIDDTDKLLSEIDKKFGWLPSFDVPTNSPAPSYTPGAAHMFQSYKTNVGLLVLMPALYQEMTLENRFRRMCENKFHSYLRDEIYKALRMENGLVYGVNKETIGPYGLLMRGFSTRTAPENVGRTVEIMAKTVRAACTTRPITDEFIKRDYSLGRLGYALWLESPERRRDRLIAEYFDYNWVYDFSKIVSMAREMTAADVIANTRGYFDRPVSIVSRDANFDADVMKIWRENFGDAAVLKHIKDAKCR